MKFLVYEMKRQSGHNVNKQADANKRIFLMTLSSQRKCQGEIHIYIYIYFIQICGYI